LIDRSIEILYSALEKSIKDRIGEHSAALAFHMVLSLPGLAMIFLIIVELFFYTAALARLISLTSNYLGENVSDLLMEVLYNISIEQNNSLLSLLGIVFLLYSGVNVATQIENTLNIIWNQKEDQYRIFSSIYDRVNKLIIVIVNIFLVFILGLVMTLINNLIISTNFILLVIFFNLIGTTIVIITLFSFMYIKLHSVDLNWRESLKGGVVAGPLFIVSQYILSYYFSLFDVGSVFGSAGAMVILLFWVYVYAHIFYFGSEIIYMTRQNSANSS
jgi:membrane protein